MAAAKRILVCGATGKQGGALISALTNSSSTPPFHLVALTRNAKSAKAQALAKTPNVTVLQGDLDDCPSIFRSSSQPFHGVFSVQVPLKPQVEEIQGKALVDAAATNGVKHFVYASVERGGPQRSDEDPTYVKHFISKFNIEQHLKAVAQQTPGLQWTIIRPVAFMDNWTPDFFGRAFQTTWAQNGMDTKLQFVSSSSIGMLAADAFKNPQEYLGRAISLATDELSPREANEVFKRAVGNDIPTTYNFVGTLLKVGLREQLGDMMKWFREEGFGADPAEFRGKVQGMQNFDEWLRQSSGWRDRIRAS